jgi:serine/threonine protein kinase
MHDAFFNQMKQTMYLVMDLVPGSSLTNLVEEQKVVFSEAQAKMIMK